jgi:hypothetical protein
MLPVPWMWPYSISVSTASYERVTKAPLIYRRTKNLRGVQLDWQSVGTALDFW